jgi:RNA polymerase sigma-70 factor (ECF subfamily)
MLSREWPVFLSGRPEHPEPQPVAESLTGALTAQARRGDAEAFEALFQLHHRQVLRVATCLLGNPDDGCDAAQEVFIRFFKYLDRFDESKPLKPWLHRMTVNVCRDLARRRRGSETVAFDDDPGAFEAPCDRPTPEQSFQQAQERDLLARAIASLPERERAAIVLRDIEGLDTKEVAALLGTTETTVRSQISLARVKIKRFRDAVLAGKEPK